MWSGRCALKAKARSSRGVSFLGLVRASARVVKRRRRSDGGSMIAEGMGVRVNCSIGVGRSWEGEKGVFEGLEICYGRRIHAAGWLVGCYDFLPCIINIHSVKLLSRRMIIGCEK